MPNAAKVSVDQQFKSYTDVQISLDRILWNNQTVFVSITVLITGAFGYLFKGSGVVALFPLPNASRFDPVASARLMLILGGILYATTWISILRTRHWHKKIEETLAGMEPD